MKNFWQNDKTDIYIKLYDDFAGNLKTKEELAFLKKQFSKEQKIIEFGCGTGRTLVPLIKAGYRISGLDFSKGMTGILKKKLSASGLSTPVFNKDLTKFSLKEKYDGGMLSQRTLNFITTPEGQRKALVNISKTLKKGSILIINLMPARPDDFSRKQVKLKKTGTFKNSSTGNKVEYWENWLPDPMSQTWNFINRFVEKNKSISTDIKMRIIFETEMKNLLELCGFKTLKVLGNWKGEKYASKSKDMIFIAKKT